MNIANLIVGRTEYTSSVWYVSGQYHAFSDVNTLIDVGYDPVVLHNLTQIKPGIGKKTLDQIILTHSHFDHTTNITTVLETYPVPVYAHPKNDIPGVIPIVDRTKITVGDEIGEIIYMPGHSEDSICILCPESRLLFSGDMPYRIFSESDEYCNDFIDAFEYICSHDIAAMYPGHGDPITGNVQHLLDDSLKLIKRSRR